MKLLVVDDSKDVRERLAAMLAEIEGIELIEQAENGVVALEAINRLRFDAVVLDIQMPRINGINVLEKIRKSDSQLVVIVLTNYAYSQYLERCMSAGANFFFDKSNEFEKVSYTLKRMAEAGKQPSDDDTLENKRRTMLTDCDDPLSM
ncbi:MAG TPA: response regulator transcription factor [Blastocatellia bacterium]|nr:response regulator transcription factor [Blastocatellia bacterium]